MTPQQLQSGIACSPATAATWAPVLTSVATKWGINTPVRVAMWVSQLAHESAKFAMLEESLFYRSPERINAIWPNRVSVGQAAALCRNPVALANRVYSGRMGNGNEASGDGYKFRGRGLLQVTGKANYAACGLVLGIDLVSNPDLLLTPQYAAESAAWFWKDNNLNVKADARDVRGVTRVINGGEHGLAERQSLFTSCCKAFGA